MTTPARPPVIPELYVGEKSWDEWIDHFESIAEVCGWEDADKLKWLRVRLSGRAGTVFRRLPDEVKADYGGAKAALRARFEPESQKTLYQTRLQTRTRRKGEGWAEFGEDLKTLADKAYPDLGIEARERFALNQYLSQLVNPQVAFAVKQTKPTTVDDAIWATLEMESYSRPVTSGIGQILEEVDAGELAVAATAQKPSELKLIMERMERIETQLKELQQPLPQNSGRGRGRRRAGRPGPRNCWNCGGEGHLARDCHSPKISRRGQGNEQPPVP